MSERGFSATYLAETAAIANGLDPDRIDEFASRLAELRERGGRLFFLGVGGGAGHASHAVNDFRKLCGLESYAPTDNVSELTARTNDEGWDTSFTEWLRVSRLSGVDGVLVFSVGGGSLDRGVSVNVAKAVEFAVAEGADVFGIVGRDDGVTAQRATLAVVVPAPEQRLTPHVEAFQAVVWHLLVTHPSLALKTGKWESLAAGT